MSEPGSGLLKDNSGASSPTANTIASHEAAVSSWMQEIAPYGILTTDGDLRIQSWNEWLETHSGFAAPLIIGRPLLEVFPELSARRLDVYFRRALGGEANVLSAAFHGYLLPFAPTVRETGFAHMQQTARIAPLSLNERFCGTITIIEDVTQREAQASTLARRHERDQLLSSALAHLLRSRDPEKMVGELFPKVAAFLNADALLNHLLQPDGEHLRLDTAVGIVESQRQPLLRLRCRDAVCGTAAAERRPVFVNDLQGSDDPKAAALKSLGLRAVVCQPLLVGDRLLGTLTFGTRSRDSFNAEELEFVEAISQYVAIALDRTMNEAALHQAKEELSEHADSLEAKVRERTARLQDTVAQLESFSYTVAHDLRAPIRALQGYALVLLDESSQLTPDKARLYLHRIERAANRLDTLTRDLLQFSTISRQDVRLSKIDVSEVVQDLVSLRPGLHEEGVLTIKQPLHAVWAHRTLLQQCLSNLLDNALKFTASGIKPRIVLWSESFAGQNLPPKTTAPQPLIPAAHPAEIQRTDTPLSSSPEETLRVRIWVEDNGIGIAAQAREKIFGIFERAHTLDHFEGTGIGLAIVARAIQRMDGTCGVESIPGQGSRFWLELKAAI